MSHNESDREALHRCLDAIPTQIWDAATESDDVTGIIDAILADGFSRTTSPDAATVAVERVRALFPDATDPCPPKTCTHADCEVINALDGAPEPEWEYGCRSSAHHEPVVLVLGLDVDEPEDHGFDCPSPALVRRRKAGAWEPAGGETP